LELPLAGLIYVKKHMHGAVDEIEIEGNVDNGEQLRVELASRGVCVCCRML
jgi:hypothetical protein